MSLDTLSFYLQMGYSVNKKHKATISLRISCLFCIFKHFPVNTV